MTEVATTLRTAYLAGPMRGHPNLNFPEFHKQAAWLRAGGWSVFSPAERDEADEALNGDFSVGQERGLDYYMQYDLAAVAQADCVICLPEWETSQGARLETVVAVELGHPVLEIVKNENGRRMLMSVEPEYIRSIFFAGGQGVIGAESQLLDTTQKMDPPEDLGFQIVDEYHVIPEEVAAGLAKLFAGSILENVGVITTAVPQETGEATWVSPNQEWNDLKNAEREHVLSEDCWCNPEKVEVDASAERKAQPIASGVLDYFPAALLEVSKVSKAGNDKHNPGQPLHHARGKSTDHSDALLRHLIDRGTVDEETGMRHSAEMAWRALALLQQELEDAGAPLARGAVLPEDG